jgi:phage tail-like protein
MMSFDEAFNISLGEVVDATVDSVEQGSLDPLIDLFTGGDDEDEDDGGGSGGSPPAESSEGRRDHDYFGDYNFVIQIDGEDNANYGAFQKCDGLSWETDLIEWRDSMDPYPRYRPGIRRFGKIKLTKGFVDNTKLWDWCQSVMKGKHDRKNGVIHLLNDDGDDSTPAVGYKFIDAFPIKWSGFKLDGKGSAGLVEEVELVVECVERE